MTRVLERPAKMSQICDKPRYGRRASNVLDDEALSGRPYGWELAGPGEGRMMPTLPSMAIFVPKAADSFWRR
jgi:hypothetical protein